MSNPTIERSRDAGNLRPRAEQRSCGTLQATPAARGAEQCGPPHRTVLDPFSQNRDAARAIQNSPVHPEKLSAVICAGGFRSSAATSILQQNGFTNLLNITGGTTAWINAGYPVEIPPS